MSSGAAPPVRTHTGWRSNAEMIADAARLGHLTEGGRTWDGTYGYGTFWKVWYPAFLFGTDLNPLLSPARPAGLDATATDWRDGYFDHVVLDPPYKLNGTGGAEGARYGVAGPHTTTQRRLDLMRLMLAEGARVLRPGGTLLYKCQDQTVNGRKVWQTDMITNMAALQALDKIDLLQLESYRAQPARSTCTECGLRIMQRADGRWGDLRRGDWNEDPYGEDHGGHRPDPAENGQRLSHANYSTLLIFRKAT